ncbi:hypothetical protein PFBG_01396 [Plasmodium falciparum 7G8]|uniref:Uncharacterized protein n=2 Tax=Plasmodium falciparum TaxID=5833 RepID=A0A024XC63_PLAFC|nr:hypothetical protein PFMC_01415 [Plasmodium falciparum CAMP/Malaysia]EUR75273.1 hypothetical protein PFBG_01396 [Plasmodium falciparum 7G8]
MDIYLYVTISHINIHTPYIFYHNSYNIQKIHINNRFLKMVYIRRQNIFVKKISYYMKTSSIKFEEYFNCTFLPECLFYYSI